MPLTAAFTFPWGRYHATPWGANPNDQQVEIPPSPWRILRALYAVWKQRSPRAEEGTELSETTVHDLLARLASQDPYYVLPPYRLTGTRHYYPDSEHRSGSISKDRALDNFAQLDGDATIYAKWNLDLPAEEGKALEQLLASLPYLGRADSICDARIERAPNFTEQHQEVRPILSEDELAPGQELARLLAPDLPLALDALLLRPVEVRAQNLLYPPASRHVDYAMTRSKERQPSRRPARRSKNADDDPPNAALLSVHGTPNPRMTDAVAVTDALRMTCLKILGDDAPTSVLVGKRRDHTPSQDNHQHAHYLAIPADDGTIDALAIWAPGGLGKRERAVLSRLHARTVGAPAFVKSAPHNLSVRVLAEGEAEAVLPGPFVGPSRTWISSTPFVPTRHHKKGQNWPAYLKEMIEKELTTRGITTRVRFHHLPDQPSDFPLYRKRRLPRREGSQPPENAESRHSLNLRLEFEAPVSGPIVLGALSHFGLGLFRAV